MTEFTQSKTKRCFFKSTAFLTAVFFVFTSVLSSADASNLAGTAFDKAALPLGTDVSKSASLSRLSVPSEFGKIKNNFVGHRDQSFVLIQNAHINQEAQHHIADLLGYFHDEHGLKLVALEGAEGELSAELFTTLPSQQARRDVAETLLKEGRLTGSEFYALVENPAMELFGVEDNSVYEENRQAYLEALNFTERDKAVLAGLEKILETLSRFIFSEPMRRLHRESQRFAQERNRLASYLQYLMSAAEEQGLSQEPYSEIHSMIQLIQLEGQIDFEKAKDEIEPLTHELQGRLSGTELQQFLDLTDRFQSGQLKAALYYDALEKTAADVLETRQREEGSSTQGIELSKYKNVFNYLKYMQLYETAGITIFDEISEVEKQLRNIFLKTPEAQKLNQLLTIVDTMRAMIGFSLTSKDADFYFKNKENFKSEVFKEFIQPLLEQYHIEKGLWPSDIRVLDEDLPRIERFYQLALKRDHILTERTVARAEKQKAPLTAVITGGFHTPGMEAYLQENGYSYAVVTPNINKPMDQKKESLLYEQALRETPLSMEQQFMEAFSAAQGNRLNDPRYQLEARLLYEALSRLGALGRQDFADFRGEDPREALAFYAVIMAHAVDAMQGGSESWPEKMALVKAQGNDSLAASLTKVENWLESGTRYLDEDLGEQLFVFPDEVAVGGSRVVLWLHPTELANGKARRSFQGVRNLFPPFDIGNNRAVSVGIVTASELGAILTPFEVAAVRSEVRAITGFLKTTEKRPDPIRRLKFEPLEKRVLFNVDNTGLPLEIPDIDEPPAIVAPVDLFETSQERQRAAELEATLVDIVGAAPLRTVEVSAEGEGGVIVTPIIEPLRTTEAIPGSGLALIQKAVDPEQFGDQAFENSGVITTLVQNISRDADGNFIFNSTAVPFNPETVQALANFLNTNTPGASIFAKFLSGLELVPGGGLEAARNAFSQPTRAGDVTALLFRLDGVFNFDATHDGAVTPEDNAPTSQPLELIIQGLEGLNSTNQDVLDLVHFTLGQNLLPELQQVYNAGHSDRMPGTTFGRLNYFISVTNREALANGKFSLNPTPALSVSVKDYVLFLKTMFDNPEFRAANPDAAKVTAYILGQGPDPALPADSQAVVRYFEDLDANDPAYGPRARQLIMAVQTDPSGAGVRTTEVLQRLIYTALASGNFLLIPNAGRVSQEVVLQERELGETKPALFFKVLDSEKTNPMQLKAIEDFIYGANEVMTLEAPVFSPPSGGGAASAGQPHIITFVASYLERGPGGTIIIRAVTAQRYGLGAHIQGLDQLSNFDRQTSSSSPPQGGVTLEGDELKSTSPSSGSQEGISRPRLDDFSSAEILGGWTPGYVIGEEHPDAQTRREYTSGTASLPHFNIYAEVPEAPDSEVDPGAGERAAPSEATLRLRAEEIVSGSGLELLVNNFNEDVGSLLSFFLAEGSVGGDGSLHLKQALGEGNVSPVNFAESGEKILEAFTHFLNKDAAALTLARFLTGKDMTDGEALKPLRRTLQQALLAGDNFESRRILQSVLDLSAAKKLADAVVPPVEPASSGEATVRVTPTGEAVEKGEVSSPSEAKRSEVREAGLKGALDSVRAQQLPLTLNEILGHPEFMQAFPRLLTAALEARGQKLPEASEPRGYDLMVTPWKGIESTADLKLVLSRLPETNAEAKVYFSDISAEQLVQATQLVEALPSVLKAKVVLSLKPLEQLTRELMIAFEISKEAAVQLSGEALRTHAVFMKGAGAAMLSQTTYDLLVVGDAGLRSVNVDRNLITELAAQWQAELTRTAALARSA